MAAGVIAAAETGGVAEIRVVATVDGVVTCAAVIVVAVVPQGTVHPLAVVRGPVVVLQEEDHKTVEVLRNRAVVVEVPLEGRANDERRYPNDGKTM